jgi:hypothetical protein
MKKLYFIFTIFSLLSAQAYAQNNNWQIAKSTHFVIYYKNAPNNFIKQVTEKSEDYYNRIASDLGFMRYNFWLWDNRAKIYIYDSAQDYQKGTGQAAWSAGSTIAQDKVISTFIGTQGFFDTTLPHEMGHIIFREFAGYDNSAVPLWLEEGVASYQEKNKYSMANQFIKNEIKESRFLTLKQLSGFNINSTDDNAVKLFYAEAFSIVDFLIKKFGSDTFVLFCQNLRDKRNLQRAIASVYPFSNLEEMDEAWQKYLGK